MSSSYLFLIICSNNKLPGGVGPYADTLGLAGTLAEHKHDLLEARNAVWQMIMENQKKRDNVLLGKLQRNSGLVAGPDLGGFDPEGQYLPAAQRYHGSFYRAMGADAADRLLEARHHVLILSGLYGLLRPAEPIQDYSCHIDDHPLIRPRWRDQGLLTTIFRQYLKNNSITCVFDFAALVGYRELINWNTLKQRAPDVTVRHAFGRQAVGDGLLTPLGELFGRWLQDADGTELGKVASGTQTEVDTKTERIYFTREDQPDVSSPREMSHEQQAADRKDEIVRLARCLKYLLADLGKKSKLDELHPVIDSLKGKPQLRLDADTAAAMHAILTLRDKVEHELYPPASPADLDDQLHDFRRVEAWARRNGVLKHQFQECQGL